MKNDTTILTPVPASCPACGRVLPADSPGGLCARCLMEQALTEPEGSAPAAPVPAPADPAAAPPPRLGHYELLDLIAQGGMGVVYRARDTRLHRTVALKMIGSGYLATAAEVERFKVEAEAGARLEHPNIVPIYEVGEAAGRHFFTMKLVEGGSLAEAVAGRPLPPVRAARLLATVARAVHYAHERGVLHRDLKPTNILLDAQGEPQLTDFGLAKIAERGASLTGSLAVLGSASYMAPEQARGQVKQLTTAADVYSLGAVLYETLTGRPPFEAATMVDTLRRVVEEEPRPPRAWNPAVPPDLETICLKCLEKEPHRRYLSALELAEELERFLRHEPIRARPSSAGERALKWVRRKPAVAALLAAVGLVALAGFGAVLWQLQQTRAALRLAHQNALAEATAHAPAVRPRLVLRHETGPAPRPLVAALFSPDGRWLLTAGRDQTAVLWDAATGQRLRTLAGHSGVLGGAAFSADGRRVLTWSFDSLTRFPLLDPAGRPLVRSRSHEYGDQSARLWDAETGTTLLVLTNPGAQISSAALSPDGRLLATAGYDNVARLWDAQRGRLLHTLTGHTAAILSVQFSPDSQRLLTTSDGMAYQLRFEKGPHSGGLSGGSHSSYEREIVRLWDVQTGRQVGALRNRGRLNPLLHADSHTRARFSAEGRWIVTAPANLANLGVWDARTGACRARLRGHRHEVNEAVFSPDGRRVLTAGADNTARLWDAASGRELAVLAAHQGPVLGAAFSPDGQRCATASADGTVRIWDAATGRGLAVLQGHEGKVFTVAFSPDGARVVSASEDGTAQVWDAATLEQLSLRLEGHRGEVTAVEFSPDSQRVVTASRDKTARVWDVASGRLVSVLQGLAHLRDRDTRKAILGEVTSAAFSPDGRRVVTASDDREAVLLPWFSRSVFRSPVGPSGWPPAEGQPVPFTPGRIYDAETGRELLGLPGDGCGLSHAAFSPDGARVLIVSNGRQRRAAIRPGVGSSYGSSGSKRGPLDVQLRDARTGVLLATLGGHTNLIRFALFSPDGRRVLTAEQRLLRLWDAASGRELLAFPKPVSPVFASFSPDSERILAEEWGRAVIYDASTGRELARFAELQGQVTCAVFSPDGRKVALGGRHGSGVVCDAANGERLLAFEGRKGAIGRLVFSPDSRLLVALDQSHEARVFDTTVAPPAARLVAALDAHADQVLHAAFSPDGRWLATASKDYTARLWPVSALAAGQGTRAGAEQGLPADTGAKPR